VPVLDIIHIFSNKHQKAINNYRKTGQVESEALEMRFVDRINYLFLELAECVALGYEPREIWLREALDTSGQAESAAPKPDEPILATEQGDGKPCCGHPSNEQCCEAAPPAPPATKGEQREKKQRRRPVRPRVPQDNDNIPIATQDRRFDPEVIAERARAKRQQ
ncbi:hypothetical protein LCGC14_2630970, partial [marine sediment metagenome]